MAVVLITHDLTIVKQFSDYVYVMQHGEMREHNTTQQLLLHRTTPIRESSLHRSRMARRSPCRRIPVCC